MEDIFEPAFVKKLFNRMSNSYERMNYITSFGFSIIWRKQFINKLRQDNSKVQVLDLLSGMGENWKLLNNRYPNADFFALDFSEEMISSSDKKNQKLRNKFIILNQDVLSCSIEENKFDIITCAFGLKTFNEQQLILLARLIHSILKPGGSFTFIEVSKPSNNLLLFFYRFYLKSIVPILGKLLLGNPTDYKMLWKYTEIFQNAIRSKDIFEKEGLEVSYEKYFFGCATGIFGSKKVI